MTNARTRCSAVVPIIMLLAGCSETALPVTPSPAPATAVAAPSSPTVGSDSGPVLMTGTTILPGDAIDVRIEDGDPRCFPRWDATGRCRQFDVTMPASGLLLAFLTVSPSRGIWDPDVFIVAPDGRWENGALQVQKGLIYRVLVMSYGPFPDTIRLTLELRESS